MRPNVTPDFVEKFWQRVDRSGGPESCHPWIAGLSPRGYGVVSHKGVEAFGTKNMRAHRVAYFLAHGELPETPFEVAHTCDNRACCNDRHLKAMTHAENVADRNDKGRQDHGPNAPRFTPLPKRGWRRGEQAARAKLTADDVREIRRRYIKGKRGLGIHAFAVEYGVADFAIEMIVKRKSWAHID